MVEEAVSFYQKQFTQEEESIDYTLLDHIPNMISTDTNDFLCTHPDHEEIKKAIFMMNGGSVYAPNGLPDLFYQSPDRLPGLVYWTCWDIVGGDITKIVQTIFRGTIFLRKLLTQTLFFF